MNVTPVWDWTFMWQMFYNFMASGSPFVMMIVAVSLAGLLLGYLVSIFMRRRS